MLPVTDLSATRVQIPAAFLDLDNTGSDEDFRGPGRVGACTGNVLLFRAGGNYWAALCRDAESESKLTSDACPAALADALELAAKDGFLTQVSKEVFDKGPEAAAMEALVSHQLRSPRDTHFAQAETELDHLASGCLTGGSASGLDSTDASGDGSIFHPFRFPTKMSDAFRLPWADIGVVSDEQLRSFYEGTQMRSTPKRVIGAVGYLHHHYLRPYKHKVISKGRHLLVIKISETSGRRPQKRCLAWWMPLTEVRARYADPKKAEMHHEGGSVHRVCQLVETYKLQATVPIHFEIGERPHIIVGGFPLHCFDLDVDFHTRWSLGSKPEALLEEKREVAHCLATRSVLEMSAEARKAEKRRRKRQNRKARDKEMAAEDVGTDRNEETHEVEAEQEDGRRARLQPNEALRDSSFLSGLLEQMRQRKVAMASSQLDVQGTPPAWVAA